jgi:hypothetical protein
LEPTVNSRAYAFAYLIQDPAELPADFPVDEGFDYSLFLPQELVRRFSSPAYPPRILLLGPNHISLYFHPACGQALVTIPFHEISYIALERFLVDCSLTFFTGAQAVAAPFHGRDREHVADFLARLKLRLCVEAPQTPIAEPQNFGSLPDHKFREIETILHVDPAVVVGRFFIPPREVVTPGLFKPKSSWTSGSEIVLTRDDLHLFSDKQHGYRQLYGFMASWAPLRNVLGIEWDDVALAITIRLSGDLSLDVPVPDDLREEAEKFVNFAVGKISTSGSS